MSAEIILKAYERRSSQGKYDLSKVKENDLFASLLEFLKIQSSTNPDWEILLFAGSNTKHLDIDDMELMLIEYADYDKNRSLAWGIVGWFLFRYWSGRDLVRYDMVGKLIGSLSMEHVLDYLPDGPLCALRTCLDLSKDEKMSNMIISSVHNIKLSTKLSNIAKGAYERLMKERRR